MTDRRGTLVAVNPNRAKCHRFSAYVAANEDLETFRRVNCILSDFRTRKCAERTHGLTASWRASIVSAHRSCSLRAMRRSVLPNDEQHRRSLDDTGSIRD